MKWTYYRELKDEWEAGKEHFLNILKPLWQEDARLALQKSVKIFQVSESRKILCLHLSKNMITKAEVVFST